MTISPDALQAIALTVDTINVQWNNGEAYDDVELEYNEDGGVWRLWDSLSGSTESDIVDGVSPNVVMGFRARGRVSGVWSSYSNEDYTTCVTSTAAETMTLTDAFVDDYITGSLITEAM